MDLSQLPDPTLCIVETCVGFLQPPELTFSVLSHDLVHQAILLCHGACVHLSQPSGPVIYVTGFLCTCFVSLAHLLCHGDVCTCLRSPGLLSASWCLRALVLASQACPLSQGLCALASAHQAHPLCCGACFGSLSPLSVPQVFCVLEKFVCGASLGTLVLSPLLWGFCTFLSVPQAHCLVEAMVHELFMG